VKEAANAALGRANTAGAVDEAVDGVEKKAQERGEEGCMDVDDGSLNSFHAPGPLQCVYVYICMYVHIYIYNPD
jgi:hypothetical protein